MLVAQTALAAVPVVAESPRKIPVAYDVDVVVVGGSSAGVAAAVAAAKGGAKVFLAAQRPYLGEDMCGYSTRPRRRNRRRRPSRGQSALIGHKNAPPVPPGGPVHTSSHFRGVNQACEPSV